ncbi:hypothetical protein [Mycobacterium sp. PSTR-4-N]|nr:hypothetical protein [Mycobacterium sp. PSTR-4-N]MCG7595864.1 hypothetical protein [Mycobacterium sp. PSTR-4-N]
MGRDVCRHAVDATGPQLVGQGASEVGELERFAFLQRGIVVDDGLPQAGV